MTTIQYIKWGITAFMTLSALTGCNVNANKQSHEHNAVPVRVINVTESLISGSKTYIGTATPSKTAVVSCSYPGTVIRLNVSKGSIVKKGEIIAEIESQTVISTAEMAKATLKQAEDGYSRVCQVHQSGSIPDVKLIEVQTQLSKARAANEAAQKALENCKIKAPFDGVIADIPVEEGIESGAMEPIARILDISSVEIKFPVPEQEIGDIHTGDTFSIKIPALNNQTFNTLLKSKGIEASPVSHCYDCILVPEKKINGLMPGMVCKVSLAEKSGNTIVIPASTVKTDINGRYVWTVKDNTVYKKYIVIDGFAGKGVLVKEGLSQGDKIISEGSQKVSSGMKVTEIE